MLSQQGFNLWADHYDQTVSLTEERDAYPFAGYKKILNLIYNEVMQSEKASILDIGFGTSILTSKLYEHGHIIHGLDFSERMIELAQEKMPKADLLKWDISHGLPAQLAEKKYDYIISTYTLHHLHNEQKVTLIKSLLNNLIHDGKILIGDIAFQSSVELEACKAEYINEWDDDEYYFIHEELSTMINSFCSCVYQQISHCGGIYILTHK